MADDPRPDQPAFQRVGFTLTTAVVFVAAIVAAIVLGNAIGAAQQPLGWALACAVVATLLRPAVDLLDRWLPHWLALVATLLGTALILGGAWAGAVATIADNVEKAKEEAPAAAAEIEADNEAARDFRLEERITTLVEDLDERLGTSAQVRRSASTASTYVVTGILVLFLLVYGQRFVQGGLNQIQDPERRRRVAAIGGRAIRRAQAYVLVTVAQVVVVATVSYVIFWWLELPAPFLLGLGVGALSAIPYIGIVLGGLAPLLFAAGGREGRDVIVVLALIVGLQLFEALVIRRRVDPVTVAVGPALPLILALVGWELYGVGGAVYTVILLVFALALADAIAAESGDTAPAVEKATP